jgi:hypothetical protein
MSYGLDLVRLPPGVDPDEAYKEQSEARERQLAEGRRRDPGPIDPKKEEVKGRLAAALMARHPSLKLAQRDYAELAKSKGIDVSEAKRLFRNLELNEERYWIQIFLFDDAAGASFTFSGSAEECTEALRLLWDCLEILESEGGYSTYDPQIGKVLNLSSDFVHVLKNACGVDHNMG